VALYNGVLDTGDEHSIIFINIQLETVPRAKKQIIVFLVSDNGKQEGKHKYKK